MILLNLGCDKYKIPGFINIDINPSVIPDVCMDILNLDQYIEKEYVDFIFAGHVFEHFNIEDAQNLAIKCFKCLKPYRVMLVVVPDFTKCSGMPLDECDRIILANGVHKTLFNKDRLSRLLLQAGFRSVSEIDNLNQVPFLLVSNVNNPVPDKWQTAILALKI